MRSLLTDTRLSLKSFLIAAAALAALSTVRADTFSAWDGGSGSWDRTYQNWDNGHKWVTNSSALLGGTAGTLTLQEDIHVKILEFASTGYAIAGSFQLDIKDGLLVDAGVAAISIGAPILISKDQVWSVADLGALLTVESVDLSIHPLIISGAGDVALTSGFTGLGSVVKNGTGTLTLAGNLSHTGATSVTDGVLRVTGTATNSPITVSIEGSITGSGTVGALTIGNGGILSPGLSIGTLTAGNVTWQSGGYYNWQVADATGAAGVGYDQLVSAGSLSVESTPLSRFKLNLWSLNGLVDGTPANFDPNQAYAWNIATFGSIAGFDATRFLIVRGPSEGTNGFLPETGGAFSVTSDGTHVILHYMPNAEAVWIDSTGDWSNGAKWLGGGAPLNGAAIVFAGTGGTATNNAYLSSIASIRFSSEAGGAYVVDGSALTLGSGGIINESAFTQTIATHLTLTTNSILVTHTAPLIVTGDINNAGHVLVVDGDHDTSISGDISGIGSVYKLDFGTLTLSGANTYTGGTEITVGKLILDGSIIGPLVVGERGTFSGAGTLSGGLALSGSLAAGASPGVLTQATGDTTLLTGSHFIAELGGVTPGSGDGHHDQYNILAGRCVIQIETTLDVLGWVDELGADYLPKRGDVFTVLRTSGGIVDAFGDLTNAERPNRILFDNNTNHLHLYGNLYGTGLSGTQTLAAYALTSNQSAFASALEKAAITAAPSSTVDHPSGFINSTEVGGRVVLAVLKGESYDPYLPEVYFGTTDYALTSLRGAVDSFLNRRNLSQPGAWEFTLSQGYLTANRNEGSTQSFDRNLSASNSVLGAACDVGPATTIGFFLGINNGKFSTRYSRTDLSGSVHGFTVVQRLSIGTPSVLKACIAWANFDFTTIRSMNLGASGDGQIILSSETSVARDIPLTAQSVQITADIQLVEKSGSELNAVIGFVHGRSTLGAFTESGSGANLSVAVDPDEASRGILGFNFNYAPTSFTAFALTAAIEREMGNPAVSLNATLTGETFATRESSADRNTGLVGLTFAQQLTGQTSLQLSAEFRFNKDSREDQRYNLSVSKRF